MELLNKKGICNMKKSYIVVELQFSDDSTGREIIDKTNLVSFGLSAYSHNIFEIYGDEAVNLEKYLDESY